MKSLIDYLESANERTSTNQFPSPWMLTLANATFQIYYLKGIRFGCHSSDRLILSANGSGKFGVRALGAAFDDPIAHVGLANPGFQNRYRITDF